MQRPTLILLGMAALLAAGMGLSIYSTQVVFDTLSMSQNSVELGVPLSISSDIPPGEGVFAVEIIDYTEGMRLNAQVLGPLGSSMRSVTIDDSVYQDVFIVDEQHQYTLVLESDYSESINVVAVIGPAPDAAQNTLGFVSLYMLLVGVVGMIASTVYVIILRRRSDRPRLGY